MSKLIVLNKYKDVLDYFKEHGYNDSVSVVSLEEGVGRIKIISENGFDLVVYAGDKNKLSYKLIGELYEFQKKLRKSKYVHGETIYC